MEFKIITITLLVMISIIIHKKHLSKLELHKEGYTTIYLGSPVYSLTAWAIMFVIIFNKNQFGSILVIFLVISLVSLMALYMKGIIIRYNDQEIELEYITGEKEVFTYDKIIKISRRTPLRRKHQGITYLYIKFRISDSETRTISLNYYNKKTKMLLKKLVDKNIIESAKPTFFGKFKMINK